MPKLALPQTGIRKIDKIFSQTNRPTKPHDNFDCQSFELRVNQDTNAMVKYIKSNT